jgi:hypothetical protein
LLALGIWTWGDMVVVSGLRLIVATVVASFRLEEEEQKSAILDVTYMVMEG